jgi:curved DNA-binding protein CbpA
MVDHYACLGVARTSEDVVIRAAYLALMRRYHPDTNPSPEAADRARQVIRAFAVLGDKEKRRLYDRQWHLHEPEVHISSRHKPVPVGPVGFAVTMLCVSVVVGVIWTMQPALVLPPEMVDQPNTRGSRDSSRNGGCTSTTVTKLVRRELMRQTMLMRGAGQSEFSDLASRVEMRTKSGPSLAGPVAGAISCSAAVTLDLPRGVESVAGNAALYGNIDYSVRMSPSGGPEIELTADPGLLVDLASLRKSSVPARDPGLVGATVADPISHASLPKAPAPAAAPRPTSRSAAGLPQPKPRLVNSQPRPRARPACDGDRWTTLICSDQNLAALNRQLADFERQSSSHANAQKRERLDRTRAQFEARRTECRSEACIRRALVARTIEVADIMRAAPVKP